MLHSIYRNLYTLIKIYQEKENIKLDDRQVKVLLKYYANNILIGNEPSEKLLNNLEKCIAENEFNPAKPLTRFDEETRKKRRHKAQVVREATVDYSMYSLDESKYYDVRPKIDIEQRGFGRLYHSAMWYDNKCSVDDERRYNDDVIRHFHPASAEEYVAELMEKNNISKEKAKEQADRERGTIIYNRIKEVYDMILRADEMIDLEKLTDEQIRKNVCELWQNLIVCNEVKTLSNLKTDVIYTDEQMAFFKKHTQFMESEYGRLQSKISMMGSHDYEYVDINEMMGMDPNEIESTLINGEDEYKFNLKREQKTIDRLEAKHDRTADEELILKFAKRVSNNQNMDKEYINERITSIMGSSSEDFAHTFSWLVMNRNFLIEYSFGEVMRDFGMGYTVHENDIKKTVPDKETRFYYPSDEKNEVAFETPNDLKKITFNNMRPVVFEKDDRVAVVSFTGKKDGKVCTINEPEALYNLSLSHMNEKLLKELENLDNAFMRKRNAMKGSPYNSVVESLRAFEGLGQLGTSENDRREAIEALTNLLDNCERYISYKEENINNNRTGSPRENNRIEAVKAVRRFAKKKTQELAVVEKARESLEKMKNFGFINTVAMPELDAICHEDVLAFDKAMQEQNPKYGKLALLDNKQLSKAIQNCESYRKSLEKMTPDILDKLKTDNDYRKSITAEVHKQVFGEFKKRKRKIESVDNSNRIVNTNNIRINDAKTM